MTIKNQNQSNPKTATPEKRVIVIAGDMILCYDWGKGSAEADRLAKKVLVGLWSRLTIHT